MATDYTPLTDEQLTAGFAAAQQSIERAQAEQTAIDKERRRRRAVALLEIKKAEIEQLQKEASA